MVLEMIAYYLLHSRNFKVFCFEYPKIWIFIDLGWLTTMTRIILLKKWLWYSFNFGMYFVIYSTEDSTNANQTNNNDKQIKK